MSAKLPQFSILHESNLANNAIYHPKRLLSDMKYLF